MTRPFPAEHYPPGMEPPAEPVEWDAGGVPLSRHALSASALAAITRDLRGRASALRAVPVRTLLDLLGAVHAGWAAPSSPWREEAVSRLHSVTGYPPRVLDDSLRGLFGGMDAGEMERWLTAGGVDPITMLDGVPGTAGNALAFGPELTAVVSSGNIPGAAVPSVAQALLLKSPCLVKTGSDEPVLLPLYARSIAEKAPEVPRALLVTGWEGGRADLEEALLGEVEALVVYGSDAALASLRARLPVRARFLGYGHRISFSAVGREVLTAGDLAQTAERAALDFCVFDQQGCLSPQALYVERGAEVAPGAFAERVATAMQQIEERLPRRRLGPAEAAAIHQYRTSVEMRSLSDPEIRLWSSPDGTRWTVVLDPDPFLRPCCLNRTVVVRSVERLEDLPRFIAPAGKHLMSVALGVSEERRKSLARALGAAGVARVTPLGKAQDPDGALFHDGVNAVGPLARFVRIEGC